MSHNAETRRDNLISALRSTSAWPSSCAFRRRLSWAPWRTSWTGSWPLLRVPAGGGVSAKVEKRGVSGQSLDAAAVCGLRGAARRRAAGAISMQRSIAALWRVARARGGRGRLLVGLEDAGTRGGVTRRVTDCDVLELKRPRGKNASTKCSSEAQQAVKCQLCVRACIAPTWTRRAPGPQQKPHLTCSRKSRSDRSVAS